MGRSRLHGRLPAITPAALGAVLLAAGCERAAPPPAQAAGPRPTPAPTFTLPVDSSSHAALLAYAHTLTFDTTAPGVDRRYLVVGQGQHLAVGPFVELAPEIGSAAVGHADLVRGRILARITVDGTRPVGTVTGVAYLWVDSTAGGLRAVVVPESPTEGLKSTAVSLGGYGSDRSYCPNFAVARIVAQRVGYGPPGQVAPRTMMAVAKPVCWPCDCGICCADTSFSSYKSLAAATAIAPPLEPMGAAKRPAERKAP